jgi:hypothetical protein
MNHGYDEQLVQLPNGAYVYMLSGKSVEGTVSLAGKDVMILA